MQEGQLTIEYRRENGELRVTLPNFPTPDETTDGITPKPLYRNPETGELTADAPIHKDQQDEQSVLMRRDDNDEVCGFILNKFNYGDNASLINYSAMGDPYLVLNPPEL